MPPRTTKICSSFALSRAFRARIIVAAVFGAGACPGWVLAQQAGGGTMPRRAESTAAVERAGSPRAIPPAGQAARGGNAHAKVAAATSGRTGPRANTAASTRARAPASGVRQTSAVVTADGGVVLAGHAEAAADCRQCGQRGCGKCRPAGGRLDLPCNGLCSQGSCPAHCPVRPDQFGYYATRWRSWPGQNVKQVGHFDPATTPVVPPRSEVPKMADELALPNQQEEGASDDGDEEEGDEDGKDGEEMSGDGAPGDAPPPLKAEEAGDASKPVDAIEEDKPAAAVDGELTGSASSAGPSDDSGAAAALPAGTFAGIAWANLGRGTPAKSTPAPRGNVVQTSAPVEAAKSDRPAGDRDTPKLRSPAQKLVEQSEQAVGRWRAKAAVAGATVGSTAANPLRGVTAQPGTPLR